jgi:uncharacterized protein YlxW (UPF0749 family)
MNQQPSALQRVSAMKGRLVQALADLATLDEQREKLKDEISALRNYVNGIALGRSAAAEQREIENKQLAEALREQAAEEFPANAGGTD